MLAARGGCSAWKDGLGKGCGSVQVAGPSPSSRGNSGNPETSCEASGSLLGGAPRRFSRSGGTVLGAGGACERTPAWLAVTHRSGASWSIVLASGPSPDSAQPQGCRMALHPAGLHFLRWSLAPVGSSRAPPCKAVPLRACCLSTNKYMCLQVNPPFLCEHVSVDSLTTLSMPQYLFISSYRRAAVNSEPSASCICCLSFSSPSLAEPQPGQKLAHQTRIKSKHEIDNKGLNTPTSEALLALTEAPGF